MLRVVKLIVYLLGSGVLLNAAGATANVSSKQILGLHEYVHIAEFDISLKAKLDTGATTSSLSATDIKEFERDGEDWVSFRLAFKEATDKTYELPVSRISKIKHRAGEKIIHNKKYSSRPVVDLKVTMGDETHTIEVNLADRTRFKYPFLVGSKALKKFNAIVDPAVSFTANLQVSDDIKRSNDVKTSGDVKAPVDSKTSKPIK